MTLTWDDKLNPAGTTYNVYRAVGLCSGSLEFSKLASGLAARTFLDTMVIPGDYCYAVTAVANGVESAQSDTALAEVPGVTLQPPLTIATASPLPSGTLGAPYVYPFGASGGTPGYTWSLPTGIVPPGLSISATGFISGTPTTPGPYTFTVRVTDSTGQTAAKDFSLIILPTPVVITTTSSLPSAPMGAPLTIKFVATGGVPPYAFGVTGSLPPGTSLAANGTLSGTPVATGTFAFRVAVADTFNGTTFKDFTITITPPLLTISTTLPLANGQVGVGYSTQFAVAGGIPPYTWTGSGAPAGLSFSSTGLLSGTPTATGAFSLSITVTDSAGTKATGAFAITVIPAALVITTASLPNGTAGAAYSGSLAASGGVPPYTWSMSGLPDGVNGAVNGAISGIPTTAGQFTVAVTVKDSAGATTPQTYSVTISPPPLVITTESMPDGVVGAAYSVTLLASGGVPPYSWSATGLPASFDLTSVGGLSGTPAAPGATSLTVTVKDTAGTIVSRTFQVKMVLPPPPPLTFNGLSDNSNPATQPRLQIAFGASFPVDITVVLTLAFKPDSGADDPAVQFSTGGRTARITVPAGSTTGETDVGVQTGTVAGTITITSQLLAPAQDITPSPAPGRTIRIGATAPVISSVTATRNSTGFTVVIVGYASSRDLTLASLQFTAAAGANLEPSSLTVPLDALFTEWYSSPASAPYGSQFALTEPFTVQGSPQAILSVMVTLTSKVGTSAPASANLQ